MKQNMRKKRQKTKTKRGQTLKPKHHHLPRDLNQVIIKYLYRHINENRDWERERERERNREWQSNEIAIPQPPIYSYNRGKEKGKHWASVVIIIIYSSKIQLRM